MGYFVCTCRSFATTMSQHNSVTTQQCHNTTVSQHNTVTTQQCHNTTVSQHNTVTTQQYHHTTLSQHNSVNSKSVIFQESLLKGLKCCNFLWVRRRHSCSPAASFANCVMTLYLLKVHLQTFLSILITQKCQILSCDTLVANGRYSVRHVTRYLTLLILRKWLRWCITVKKGCSFIYPVFRCRTEVCCARSQRDKASCSVKAAYGPTPTAGAETPLVLSRFQSRERLLPQQLLYMTHVSPSSKDRH